MQDRHRILFFSCEPGGAEVLIPAIKLLQAQEKFDVDVIGYGFALERFKSKQVACKQIPSIMLDDFSILESHAPHLVITSATSLPSVDMTEKILWYQARQHGIQSIAFLGRQSKGL